jgi:hypothetical protein
MSLRGSAATDAISLTTIREGDCFAKERLAATYVEKCRCEEGVFRPTKQSPSVSFEELLWLEKFCQPKNNYIKDKEPQSLILILQVGKQIRAQVTFTEGGHNHHDEFALIFLALRYLQRRPGGCPG